MPKAPVSDVSTKTVWMPLRLIHTWNTLISPMMTCMVRVRNTSRSRGILGASRPKSTQARVLPKAHRRKGRMP